MRAAGMLRCSLCSPSRCSCSPWWRPCIRLCSDSKGVVLLRFVIGCSYRNTPIALRERLAFDGAKLAAALDEISARYGCEVVVLSTCNRVELYLARGDEHDVPDAGLISEFLAEAHELRAEEVRAAL